MDINQTASDKPDPQPGGDELCEMLQSVSLGENQATGAACEQQKAEQASGHGECRCEQVLLSGIPQIKQVTNDHLTNFLESHCLPDDVSVKGVKRGTKKDVAIVIFSKPVDLSTLQNACNENPVSDNVKLRVGSVVDRGTVLVRNPHIGTQTESFLFYVKNARRSGGEKEATVERDPDNKYLIVHFSSPEVAGGFAQRDHVLEGHFLDMAVFDINLDHLPLTEDQGKSTLPEHTFQNASLSDNANGNIGSDFQNLSLNTRLENVRQELENPPPEEVTCIVEGVHDIYCGIIDIFTEMIPHLFGNITVDVDGSTVKVKGEEGVVERAVVLLNNLKQKEEKSFFLHEIPSDFCGWENIFEEIEEACKRDSEFPYVLHMREGVNDAGDTEEELCISADCRESLSFDEFLKMFVNKEEIEVESKSGRELLSSTKWEGFIEVVFYPDFGKRVMAVKDENCRKVTLFGSVKCLNRATDSVLNFLKDAPVDDHLQLSSIQQKFFAAFSKEKVKKITEEVEFRMEGDICKLSGRLLGVHEAMRLLKNLRDSLRCTRAIFSSSDLSTIARTKEWDEMLQDVGSDYRCIISSLPDVTVKDADKGEEWGPWAASVLYSVPVPDTSIWCHLVEGDVAAMKVDAIVVCHRLQVFPDANTRRGDSALNNAGARPRDYTSYGMPSSDSAASTGVTVVQPGALPCKAIIQVDVEKCLQQGREEEDRWLKSLVRDVLQKADSWGFTSLAVPVLGVDVPISEKPLPVAVATSTIVQSIAQHFGHRPFTDDLHMVYERQDKISSLQNICLCSCRAACIRAYCDALKDQNFPFMSPTPESFGLLSCVRSDDTSPKTGKPPSTSTIKIVKNNVADIKTDIVVVPLDDDLDVNKNKVTRALCHSGGPSQYELLHKTNFSWRFWKKRPEPDDWVETFSEERFLEGNWGTNNASSIFYLSLPPWGPGVNEIMTKLLKRCLLEADKKSAKTLTFTALGMGKLNYPAQFTARTMLAVISEFLEKNRCSVQSINIVVYFTDQETFNVFSEQQSLWYYQKVARDSQEDHYSHQLSYPSDQHSHPSSGTPVDHSGPRGRGGHWRGRGHQPHLPASGGRGRDSQHRSRSPAHYQRQRLRYPNPYCCTHRTFKCGDISLTVKQGDIVHEKCDIIVNSTNASFDLSKGGVSRALMKHCEKSLLDLCNKQAKKMNKKGFVMTDAPKLKARKILHVNLAKYTERAVETLRKCLEMARDCAIPCNSIAFPAFGTGDGAKKGSHSPMASALVKAVVEFKKNRSVSDVRLIVASPEHFEEMCQTMEGMLNPGQSRSNQQEKGRAVDKGSQRESGANWPSSSLTEKQALREKLRPRADSDNSDAVSVYIFSDSPGVREAAELEIASRIHNLLECFGIHHTPPPEPRGRGWGSHRETPGGGYTAVNHDYSLFYPPLM